MEKTNQEENFNTKETQNFSSETQENCGCAETKTVPKAKCGKNCRGGKEKQFIGFYAECGCEATVASEMSECEEKLFNDVFRAVEMSRYPLEAMYEKLFDCDFKRYLGEIRERFIALGQQVSEFIKDSGIEPRETGEITKMMQKGSVEIILRSKDSVKRLAEMLLKGVNMGIISIYHTYNGYQGSKVGEPYDMATRALELLNEASEKLRSFL